MFFPKLLAIFIKTRCTIYACLQLSKSARYWFAIQASNFKLSDEIWGEEKCLNSAQFHGKHLHYHILYNLPTSSLQ